MKAVSISSAIAGLALSLSHAAVAQDVAAKPKQHSIAEQMVREILERGRLQPPVVTSGVPIGEGDGKLAVLVRGADGELEVASLDRATRKEDDPPPFTIELAEEVQKRRAAAAGPDGPKARITLTIARRGEELRIESGERHSVIGGDRVDLTKLSQAMVQWRGEGATRADQLVVAAGPEMAAGDVIAAIAAARAAGFADVLLRGANGALVDAQREVIDAATTDLGWEPARDAVPPMPALFGGELVLLVDGTVTWGEVVQIYTRCTKNGIWRLAFIAVDADGHRVKIPAHVPIDG